MAPSLPNWWPLSRLSRRHQVHDEYGERSATAVDENALMNDVVRTYLHPADCAPAKRRFLLLFFFTAGAIGWWLCPMLGLFVIDPFIQLTLMTNQIINPGMDCYFPEKPAVCEQPVYTDYYFYNLTNKDQWLAGLEPPSLEEVGPYSFRMHELHFNVAFHNNWTEVESSLFQWYEFHANQSCAACDLSDTLVGVNRGYLQFLAAMRADPASRRVDFPEPLVTMELLPIALHAISTGIQGALRPGVEAYLNATLGGLPDEATIAAAVRQAALAQWTTCGTLLAVTPAEPYLPVGPAAFPYAPELCAYIPQKLAELGINVTSPAEFGAYGVDLPLAAAGVFVEAAIGATTPTQADPAAAKFVKAFISLERAQLEPLLPPALAGALAPLTYAQWDLLRGYLYEFIAPTWGKLVHEGAKAAQPDAFYTVLEPEQAVILQLSPATLGTVLQQIVAGLGAPTPLGGSVVDLLSGPTGLDAAQLAGWQWAECGALRQLAGYGVPPLLNQSVPAGQAGYPAHPELCAYLVGAAAEQWGLTIAPAQLPDVGLSLPAAGLQAFLGAALGGTNATYMDPAASQFLLAFLKSSEAAIALLDASASTRPLVQGLQSLTLVQVGMLQGYLLSLAPSWGKLVMAGLLGASGGGLVVTKTVEEMMYGFDDPLLLSAAQGAAAGAGAPDAYKLTPWLYKPSLAVGLPSREYLTQWFADATGAQYNETMLSYRSTDIGRYHPMIQQKRQYTGKGTAGAPTEIIQYRGIPLATKPYGILNFTGSDGVAFSTSFDKYDTPLSFDAVVSQTVKVAFTGDNVRVKKVPAYQFSMADASLEACNWTAYGDWALATGFDEDAYSAAAAGLAALPPAEYWDTMQNGTVLREYFNGTALGPLDRYFGQPDAGRDRCAVPNAFAAAWDMSSTFGCPVVFTFPHFHRADPALVASTGSAWSASAADHAWSFAIEPTTGFAIEGHKTYQMSHLVGRTAYLYPDLWVANGTAASTPLGFDFVTVPAAWFKIWWLPKDTDALEIRGLVKAIDEMYFTMVVAFPAVCWFFMLPSLGMLLWGKWAKQRRLELQAQQRSRARRSRLGGHELRMVDAIVRLNRGSMGVALPEDAPEGEFDDEDSQDWDEEAGGKAAEDPAARDLRRKRSSAARRAGAAAAVGAKAAAAEAALRAEEEAGSGPTIGAVRAAGAGAEPAPQDAGALAVDVAEHPTAPPLPAAGDDEAASSGCESPASTARRPLLSARPGSGAAGWPYAADQDAAGGRPGSEEQLP